MTDMHQGSCLCGGVSFRIQGPFEHFFLCHCSHCRKGTGSAHASNLFSNSAHLTWLAGEDLIARYNLPDTRHSRSFCKCCGAALPSVQQDNSGIMVPAGCLDTPVELEPTAHIFTGSRANWDEKLEDVIRFDALPTG
ncbi:Uncharacterized conserved protein [Cohaesibacter sp. ES.047]|uniref:GFA family protein n=1 Tax=Cohaesibacter sp. ES.047 TaxID=1798205 RepID=UPI000BB677B1|nr:GFA family protein [Cohaesibacter sp. ES.047]SNY92032.1 Uncharacterized conserved protein [Cohaesibacter sp. ES.047]